MSCVMLLILLVCMVWRVKSVPASKVGSVFGVSSISSGLKQKLNPIYYKAAQFDVSISLLAAAAEGTALYHLHDAHFNNSGSAGSQ